MTHHIASDSDGGPIELLIPGSGDAYLDLANTYLFVRVKVTKGNEVVLDPNNPVGPVNNWMHSLFSQVHVYLNDTLVTPLTNTYPCRAFIETALSYGTEAKEKHLKIKDNFIGNSAELNSHSDTVSKTIHVTVNNHKIQ